MGFEGYRLTRQRMVEVELNRIARAAHLLHRTRVLALAIGRRELHHIADLVFFIRVASSLSSLRATH